MKRWKKLLSQISADSEITTNFKKLLYQVYHRYNTERRCCTTLKEDYLIYSSNFGVRRKLLFEAFPMIMSFQFLFLYIFSSSVLIQMSSSIAGFDGLNHKRACKKHYCAKGYVAVPLKNLKLQAGGCDSLTNSMGGSFGQNDNSKRALEPCCNLYVNVSFLHRLFFSFFPFFTQRVFLFLLRPWHVLIIFVCLWWDFQNTDLYWTHVVEHVFLRLSTTKNVKTFVFFFN